ncbi:MAG: carboxypeptidase regulatory-like domain-containing protein, partial [Clostridia bacterium]|nr:carboxypeptidase regulatory-like domain-containing protein [Clostridia bacterium]
ELSSADTDRAEKVSGLDDYFTLMSSAKSTSDLMNSLAAQLQSSGVVDDPDDESLKNADGIKAVDALTTSQAYARSGIYYEERTWIDSPTWTREGVKWRIEELTANGYKPNYLTDSSSGREYIYFEQTLYYGQYGDPVAELYKRASDNGIPKNVVSPLMFKNGKAIGSTLRVKYVYDVTAGKWMRMQTAIMPPDTTSPIHTSPNQIPNKVERPYRYVPVSDLGLTSVGDFSLMASGQRTGGMSVKIRLDRVSEKTYGSAVCGVCSFGSSKFLSTQKLHKFVNVDNAKWGKYALSYEETASNAYWTTVGNTVPNEGQSSIVPTERDAGVGSLDALRKSLESNYRYYARLDKEGGVHRATAQYGKERTKKLLGELADLEYAIEMAGVQDAFTKSVSDQLSGASAVVGIFGGPVGAEGALVIDTINVLINAANDTNNAEVMEAAEKFKSKVDRYMSNDKADKERMKKDEQEKKDYNNSTGFPIYGVEDEVFDDPFDGGSSKPTAPTAQTVPVHDPSGVVYEGVIENPVEGATVTLYKYDAENGVPVQHDDSLYMQQQNPLTTDENGHYNWDVPEGEWYVTASKDGYISGNSGADIAATKQHTVGGEDMNFLPVLPPQLDVNI